MADVDHTNIERFCDGVDVIVDGTDNFETRFLINDVGGEAAACPGSTAAAWGPKGRR